MSSQKTLQGEDAAELWHQGKDIWNAWVKNNPDANIDFSGCTFDLKLMPVDSGPDVNFNYFIFPNGNISFNDANFFNRDISFIGTNFGNEDIDFSEAKFGNGNVDFSEATFGDGNVDFSKAKFGNGNVDFSEATFGNGNVDFSEATFGNGKISFHGAKFGSGNISFSRAEFGEGVFSFEYATIESQVLSFERAKFEKRVISFERAKFENGDISFSNAEFGKGIVSFSGVQFGIGKISFRGAQFGDRGVYFDDAVFRNRKVDFTDAHFKRAEFLNMDCKLAGGFSFKHSTIEKSLSLAGSKFGCVVDVRYITNKNIDLDGIECQVNCTRSKWFHLVSKVSDSEDMPRSRQLKEIAESNKDHDRALHFHALEMRAKRWKSRGRSASVLDGMFSFFSNYGQSIIRPSLFLALLVSIFYAFYSYISETSRHPIEGLIFSISNSMPFLSFSKVASSKGLKFMSHQDEVPYWIYGVMGFQNLLALILIFLIFLGIRNRFRI